MKISQTILPGVLIIEPTLFSDDRGLFFEIFQQTRYQQNGITGPFVQDNFSRSKQNTIRGLHYQIERPQGKLVFVTYGHVLDVIVDIRLNSPTFGKSITIELNSAQQKQLYIPKGLAHGFCVLSDYADFVYKCTDYYFPKLERGIAWNDPDLKIDWPISQPILSEKDQSYLPLNKIARQELFAIF